MITIGTTMPTAMATTFGLEEEVSEELEVWPSGGVTTGGGGVGEDGGVGVGGIGTVLGSKS
jgi:hypothetical protein